MNLPQTYKTLYVLCFVCLTLKIQLYIIQNILKCNIQDSCQCCIENSNYDIFHVTLEKCKMTML